MKKTTPAVSPSARQQNVDQQSVKSVVTRLRAKHSKAEVTSKPDIDLNELRVAIDELPTMNATKIVALHRRIVNGDYQIDSQRLAEKMIELESSLDTDQKDA